MFIVIVHLILCLVYFIVREKLISKETDTFPQVFVYILPIVGFAMWLSEYFLDKYNMAGVKSIERDKLKVEDAKYKKLLTDTSDNNSSMVPLEDALVINDAKLRRSLLLDILRKNPDEYINVLERAKTSEDVEVTHYATTTLLEIQSQFEKRLQDYKHEYSLNCEDREFLVEYRDCLKEYIDSGLIDGTVLIMQQKNLLEIIGHMRQFENTNREDAFMYIETAMDLKKFEDAKNVLDETREERFESEVWNRLAVRYYWEIGDSAKIQDILKEITENNMYLTKEGKEWFYFWSKGSQYGKNEF